jgi:hypothetical protein
MSWRTQASAAGANFLINQPQQYTTFPQSPAPPCCSARTGSYETYPWGPFHPRDVSRPLGYNLFWRS